MKIDKPGKPLPVNPISEESARSTPHSKAGAPPPAAQQPGSTSVSLGSVATQLHSMESGMANTPVVDSAKVAEIRQAISDGRFEVNSGVVADRLIATVRNLIDNQA